MDDNNEIYEPETESVTPPAGDNQTEESSTEPEMDIEAETETEPFPESSDSSEENINEGLTDRLDALIEILTPDESEEAGSESSDSGTGESENDTFSATDAYTQELLESINGTLAKIEADNISYHAEMLVNQEELLEHQEQMVKCLEFNIIVLFSIGFFIALSCGCRFADTFFNRMRG